MAFVPDRRSSRQPLLNAPPIVLWVIGVLILCHVIRMALPDGLPESVLAQYGFIPARYSAAISHPFFGGDLPGLVIPLISYMLIHADYTHAGVNCLWLLVFGPVVARRLRPIRFLLFCTFCGIAAALVHLAVYWGSPVAVIGASGAISGLMGAGMRLLYGHLYGRADGLAPVFSKPILMFSLVWTVVNIVSGVLRIGVTGELSLVAWVAHLGGYFTGLFSIGIFDGHRLAR
jgi:membrane associated rhomboid family serine protease